MDSVYLAQRLSKTLNRLDGEEIDAQELKALVERDVEIQMEASNGENIVSFPSKRSGKKVA